MQRDLLWRVRNNQRATHQRKSKEGVKRIDKRTKEKLILEYAPLIKFIAQKIAVRLPSNIEFDDLVSSGVIGLMDAIDKYDPSRDSFFGCNHSVILIP